MTAATQTSLGEIKLAGDLAGGNDANAPALSATGVTAGTYIVPTITVDAKGRISAASSSAPSVIVSAIPIATTTTPGIVKIGTGLNVTVDGTLSANTIPFATTTTKGVVQPSTGLTIGADAKLSVVTASASVLGVMTTGFGLTSASGVVSVDPTVVATFANGGNLSAPITVNKVAVPFTTTITLNFQQSNMFDTLATANFTLANPTNAVAGGVHQLVVTQDGTGSRVISWGSNFAFNGVAPTLSTAPNAIDVITMTVVSPTKILVKMTKGYA